MPLIMILIVSFGDPCSFWYLSEVALIGLNVHWYLDMHRSCCLWCKLKTSYTVFC